MSARKIIWLVLLLGLNQAANALLITPSDCNLGVNCWTVGDYNANNDPVVSGQPDVTPANTNLGADGIALVTGISDLTLLYKEDVDDGESGPLASSYETTFSNSLTDPEDALVEYTAGQAIVCPVCILEIKDGRHDPYTYLFDLSDAAFAWNGTDDLDLQNFWVGSGAISHVSIWSDEVQVPEPGSFALMVMGLLGIRLARHAKKG